MTHALRTSAGSHERFLVIEVFGRYAGFTALLPTMAGAANRCVIPEHAFDIDRLAELLVADRDVEPEPLQRRPRLGGGQDRRDERDGLLRPGDGRLRAQEARRHRRPRSPRSSSSSRRSTPAAGAINTISQRLGYLVRCGDPDALDSIVPMAFGNLAMDLILEGTYGRLVNVRNGRYDNVPVDVVTSRKKMVDLDKHYVVDRLRPRYENFENKPLFIMTSDY